jgi:transposase InsO family protein
MISPACCITQTGVPWMKIWLEEAAMRRACTSPHREMPVIPNAKIRAVARRTFTGYPSRIVFHFDAGAARGDSYDNALAETINGLYKTEVIRRREPWKNIDDVEFATLEWVDWSNNRRLLEPIGDIPPAEYEMLYWTESSSTDTVGLTELSLH